MPNKVYYERNQESFDRDGLCSHEKYKTSGSNGDRRISMLATDKIGYDIDSRTLNSELRSMFSPNNNDQSVPNNMGQYPNGAPTPTEQRRFISCGPHQRNGGGFSMIFNPYGEPYGQSKRPRLFNFVVTNAFFDEKDLINLRVPKDVIPDLRNVGDEFRFILKNWTDGTKTKKGNKKRWDVVLSVDRGATTDPDYPLGTYYSVNKIDEIPHGGVPEENTAGFFAPYFECERVYHFTGCKVGFFGVTLGTGVSVTRPTGSDQIEEYKRINYEPYVIYTSPNDASNWINSYTDYDRAFNYESVNASEISKYLNELAQAALKISTTENFDPNPFIQTRDFVKIENSDWYLFWQKILGSNFPNGEINCDVVIESFSISYKAHYYILATKNQRRRKGPYLPIVGSTREYRGELIKTGKINFIV